MLGKGDPKLTFVVGAMLSYPGVSYLDALDHIHGSTRAPSRRFAGPLLL